MSASGTSQTCCYVRNEVRFAGLNRRAIANNEILLRAIKDTLASVSARIHQLSCGAS
jgi:hypothetical protein